MSENTEVENNGQQAHFQMDLTKTFIGNNRYDKANHTNDTYDTETIPGGRLMGRVSATQEIVPHDSAASDGSQYPVGILAADYVVEEGETRELAFCTSGDVAEEKVILAAGDTMDTVIDGRSIRDRIAADTVGIILKTSQQQTEFDNE